LIFERYTTRTLISNDLYYTFESWDYQKTFENPKDSEKIRYKIIDPDVDILKL
jgi:hypothetical protein